MLFLEVFSGSVALELSLWSCRFGVVAMEFSLPNVALELSLWSHLIKGSFTHTVCASRTRIKCNKEVGSILRGRLTMNLWYRLTTVPRSNYHLIYTSFSSRSVFPTPKRHTILTTAETFPALTLNKAASKIFLAVHTSKQEKMEGVNVGVGYVAQYLGRAKFTKRDLRCRISAGIKDEGRSLRSRTSV
jgi:hypothetical protein